MDVDLVVSWELEEDDTGSRDTNFEVVGPGLLVSGADDDGIGLEVEGTGTLDSDSLLVVVFVTVDSPEEMPGEVGGAGGEGKVIVHGVGFGALLGLLEDEATGGGVEVEGAGVLIGQVVVVVILIVRVFVTGVLMVVPELT